MKKLLYLLIVLGVTVTGCNPIEDINNEIDAQANPVIGVTEFTMTTDDYTDIVDQGDDEETDYYERFEAFSDVDDAKVMLSPFLGDKYPFWGEGSSVTVNYNLYDGNPEDISAYVNADDYELASEDYPTAASNAFFPNEEPTDFLENILATQIASPVSGQVVLMEYEQYINEPEIGFAPYLEYDFAGSLEGWSIVEESGNEAAWTSQDDYVQGNGFFGGQVANVEWLVSPSIDLSGESDLRFQITRALKYANDTSLLKILVSEDYDGDTAVAEWEEITLSIPPGVDTLDPSEDYDFSAYDGQTINIAFKYESTDDDAGRWRISSMALKTVGITGDTTTKTNYYKYDGSSWNIVDDVYYLTSEDYDSMGEESGQPGRFNNFSGSTVASSYLPQFLSIRFPFAQEEDEIFLTYKYYGGSDIGTIVKGNLYTYTNGSWSPNISSLKFGFQNDVWVPDNTIRYTLTGDDYDYISAELINEAGFEAAAENVGDFGSFEIRDTDNEYWAPEMILTAMDILLDNNDPNADEDQKYILTYKTYSGSVGNADISLIKEGGEWVLNGN